MVTLSDIALRGESEILTDKELLLGAIRLYSNYFANGEQVRTCEKFVKTYIIELKRLAMLQKERTCKPIFKGTIYVTTGYFKHFSAETITDAEAIDLLKKGIMKEAQFEVLPKGYKTAPIAKTEKTVK